MSGRRIALVGVLVSLVVGSSVSGGSAAVANLSNTGLDSARLEIGGTAVRSDEDTQRDLRTLAKELDISFDEAVQRFGDQHAFYDVLDEVRTIDPDVVVRAEWREGSGVIYVQDQLLPAVVEIVAHSEVEVRGTAAIGEATQSALVEDLSAELTKFGQKAFVASYDWNTTTVLVETFGSPIVDSETLMKQSALASRLHVSLTIRESGDSAPAPAARGGMKYSNCTGGFIAKQGTERVIVTARHCDTKPATYDAATTGTTVVTSSSDLRKTSLVGTAHGPGFRRDLGLWTSATSYGDPAFGGYVCKFGTTTNNTCSVVEATGLCVKYAEWPQFCGIFRTMSDIVDPGDSGGPAFNGGRALGITSGHSPGQTSFFTQISRLSGLGVTVVTG